MRYTIYWFNKGDTHHQMLVGETTRADTALYVEETLRRRGFGVSIIATMDIR